MAIVKAAAAERVPLVARGSGTGLSGASIPVEGSVVVSFERMNRILEIDLANHVAVVEPGVTLTQLDEALRPEGLVYPVFPGEQSASLGGNVATNAGGMRAVKYGVTRHHVLGIEAVLGTGELIVSGGKFVKSTSGYDLTQLIVGSEGTLALVTRAVVRLHPRPEHQATLLAPFPTVRRIAEAVPRIVGGGISPLLLEYIDVMSMAGITAAAGIDLGIPDEVRAPDARLPGRRPRGPSPRPVGGGHTGPGRSDRRFGRDRRLRLARPSRGPAGGRPGACLLGVQGEWGG